MNGYPDDGSRFCDRGSIQESGDFVIQKLKQNVKWILYNCWRCPVHNLGLRSTGAEFGQYFCADTIKKINDVEPLEPFWVRQRILIPKWLWCKTNLVLNLTSREPVNYYQWRVREGLCWYTAPQQNFHRGRGHICLIFLVRTLTLYRVAPKNWHTFCTPYLRTPLLHQVLTDFQIYFTVSIRRTFVMKPSLKIPPHLKCVAFEMSVFKSNNWKKDDLYNI